MNASSLMKEVQEIHREGFLMKESRVFKTWRQRWMVLTNNLMLSFKERREYKNPTEVIPLRTVVSIKTCEDDRRQPNAFKVETEECTFYFSAETNLDKEQWIGAIGKAMVKCNGQGNDD